MCGDIKLNSCVKCKHLPQKNESLVRMSAICLEISPHLIWILESRIIRENNQSRATLWVLETCLMVGLLPYMIILITASLSTQPYRVWETSSTTHEPYRSVYPHVCHVFVHVSLGLHLSLQNIFWYFKSLRYSSQPKSFDLCKNSHSTSHADMSRSALMGLTDVHVQLWKDTFDVSCDHISGWGSKKEKRERVLDQRVGDKSLLSKHGCLTHVHVLVCTFLAMDVGVRLWNRFRQKLPAIRTLTKTSPLVMWEARHGSSRAPSRSVSKWLECV